MADGILVERVRRELHSHELRRPGVCSVCLPASVYGLVTCQVLASLATENKELRELLCMIYDHNPDSSEASNQQQAANIAAAQQQGIT